MIQGHFSYANVVFSLQGLTWFMIFFWVGSYHLYIYPGIRKITVKEIYW